MHKTLQDDCMNKFMKRINNEILSNRYRSRVADFVVKMAKSPVVKQTDLGRTEQSWTSNPFKEQPERVIQIDPEPFRFKSRGDKERLKSISYRNSTLDSVPFNSGKLHEFRDRNKKQELSHAMFRTKNITSIERLNQLYENDLKVLD